MFAQQAILTTLFNTRILRRNRSDLSFSNRIENYLMAIRFADLQYF